ncbi:MAG TPA: carboxypeptidase-like regulatory domain-containing protein [Gemmatimonadaceae bacterium]
MRGKGLSIIMTGLLTGAGFAGCSNDTTGPDNASPLAGLTRVEANDTGTTSGPPGQVAPGSFHGNVLGLAVNGATGDTLSSAVKLEGVKVTAYEHSGQFGTDGRPLPGAVAGSVTTDANGTFQMPELPGGEYIVTIAPQPPYDAVYHGGWTITTVSEESNRHPWWIFLPRK